MCDNAKKHDVVCIDTRPVLNGPDFEQPPDVRRAGVDGRGRRAAHADRDSRTRRMRNRTAGGTPPFEHASAPMGTIAAKESLRRSEIPLR